MDRLTRLPASNAFRQPSLLDWYGHSAAIYAMIMRKESIITIIEPDTPESRVTRVSNIAQLALIMPGQGGFSISKRCSMRRRPALLFLANAILVWHINKNRKCDESLIDKTN